MTLWPTRIARNVCATPAALVTTPTPTMSSESSTSSFRSTWPSGGNSAWSKMARIRSGFATPRPDATRIVTTMTAIVRR
jgi:hypothetical protein